jgi:gamma-glutamyltranspeptidase/glutathione hydrolase
VLRIEKNGTTLDSRRLLEMMGHRVRVIDQQGSAMGIMIDPKTGLRLGAPDPRAPDGGAVGY